MTLTRFLLLHHQPPKLNRHEAISSKFARSIVKEKIVHQRTSLVRRRAYISIFQPHRTFNLIEPVIIIDFFSRSLIAIK